MDASRFLVGAIQKAVDWFRAARRVILKPSRGKTIIGSGKRIVGDVTGAGTFTLHGECEGMLRIEGRVVLGESGKFAGAIIANEVIIGGIVEGDVKAKEKVVLLSTSRVNGDIHSPSIVIKRGARCEGDMTTEKSSNRAEFVIDEELVREVKEQGANATRAREIVGGASDTDRLRAPRGELAVR